MHRVGFYSIPPRVASTCECMAHLSVDAIAAVDAWLEAFDDSKLPATRELTGIEVLVRASD